MNRGLSDGPPQAAEWMETECLQYVGLDGGPGLCHRPKGHPPISEDGIGHSRQPIPVETPEQEADRIVGEHITAVRQALLMRLTDADRDVRAGAKNLATLRHDLADVEVDGREGAALETMLAEIETRLVAAAAIVRGLPQ